MENKRVDLSKQSNVFPKEYENKIICADSLEILKKLPDNCVDIIFTSPPYNFDIDYDKYEDKIDWDSYFDMIFSIFREGIRVLKYGRRFFVNIQPGWKEHIPTHHLIGKFFLENNMIWHSEILWEKNNYNASLCSWGSWKSPSCPYLKSTWEYVELYCKGSLKKDGDPSNIDITGDEFKKWTNAKWSIAPETRMGVFGHPAMFPEELVERSLKLFSYKGDIILDPFSGAGTTATVAKRLGRRYLGIDISQEYCEVAEKRLNEVACNQFWIT